MDVFCINSVNIDSIECIRYPCLISTVSTYIVFDGMDEKPLVSAFQNFLHMSRFVSVGDALGQE